jgi:glucose/mannose-6-phosphate isomerase
MLGSLLGLVYGKPYFSVISDALPHVDVNRISIDVPQLAGSLLGKIPVISSCGEPGVTAIRWMQELAENSKNPSIVEIYPEAAHNSIVGWENSPKVPYTFVILKYGYNELCDLIEGLLPKIYEGLGNVNVIDLREEYRASKLGAILKSSLIAGLTSIELARLKGVDPMETRNIMLYKSQVVAKLKENLMRRLNIV